MTHEQDVDGRFGTVERDAADGRWRLRFVRRLPHPVERVWRAVTEDEHLATWFPTRIIGERRAGAPLVFEFPGDEDSRFEGRMLAYDPPRLLELDWGGEVLRIELAADGDGTVLTLVDVLADPGTAARTAAGWHACLDLLAAVALGGAVPFDSGARWAAVHPQYVEAFGPEGATVGPPPGLDPR